MALEQRIDRLVDLTDRAERADRADDGGGGDGGPRLPRGARRARAVCDAMAVAVAAGPPDRSGSDDHLVVLHVAAAELAAAVASRPAAAAGDQPGPSASAEAPRAAGPRSAGVRSHVRAGRNRAMHVPPSALARLTCDAELRLAGIAHDGHPADIGRRSRKVPPDLRRALELRDRHCRFPGCHSTRGLHAHHVVHWARGGPTDLANLLLLCAHHHQFVHDRGWTLQAIDPAAGRWAFHAPDATAPTPPVWAMPGASAEAVQAADATLHPHPTALQPPWWDGWYDLDETIRVVSAYLLDHTPILADHHPHPATA